MFYVLKLVCANSCGEYNHSDGSIWPSSCQVTIFVLSQKPFLYCKILLGQLQRKVSSAKYFAQIWSKEGAIWLTCGFLTNYFLYFL